MTVTHTWKFFRAGGFGNADLPVRGHESPHGLTLYDSYHCSRYNTQARRLTAAMFRAVIEDIAKHLGH